MESNSILVSREQCPKCAEDGADNHQDNLAVYDTHVHCYRCGYHKSTSSGYQPATVSRAASGLLDFTYPSEAIFPADLNGAKVGLIRQETCRRMLYGLAKDKHGRSCHVMNYVDKDGNVVAQKLRYANKGRGVNPKAPDAPYFPWVGQAREAMPWGYHLWQKGKRLVVVEGEKDALAAYEILRGEWPVWSIINGAPGAARDLLKAMDTLKNFEEVVLIFDADEAGQKAQLEAAKALSTVCNVKLAAPLPLKDTFDMLAAQRTKEWMAAVWNAAPYRPEDIVMASSLRQRVWEKPKVFTRDYPWPWLTGKTGGMAPGDLVLLTAGSGIGKSEVMRELVYDLHQRQGEKVGLMFLEETEDKTAETLVGRHLKRRLHVDRSGITKEAFEAAWIELFGEHGERDVPLLRSIGFSNPDELIGRMRYMAKALGCHVLFLDHISIVVSSLDSSTDERKAIDHLMTKLKKLAVEEKITIVLVSHLSRPEGNKGFEDGLEPTLKHLRGSHGLAHLSDTIIALAANRRDPAVASLTKLFLLKNRARGDIEGAQWLAYDPKTGLLSEATDPHAEDAKGDARQVDLEDAPWDDPLDA